VTADSTALRQCTKCGETKPLTEYKRRKGSDGYYYYTQCNACTRAHKRQYRAANRDRINAAKRANNAHRAETQRAYLAANPEVAAARRARKRELRRQAARKNHTRVSTYEQGQQGRAQLLAYLREKIATGTMPATHHEIAAETGMTRCRVTYYLGRLFHEGMILSPTRKMDLSRITIADEPAPPIGRPCVRCGILSEHLDRCGYCCMCLYELAYGRPFDYQREPRIRVRVQGMPDPTDFGDEAIAVDDWPTVGALAGVEVRW